MDIMKQIYNIVAVACMALMLCCCSNSDNTETDSDEFDVMLNTIVTSETAEKAYSIIENAHSNGQINNGQRSYLRAVVVFKDRERFDSVITLCQPLVEMPEVKTDKKLLYRIYALMANAAEGCGNYADMIQYATKTENLAQKLGRIDKQQEMMGTVGYGMILLGRSKEGMRMINKGLENLRGRTEWNCRNSYIILSKIKIAALDEMENFSGILPVCQDIINNLSNMANHPERITKMPKEWADNKQVFSKAIDFYRTQALAYMTYSYAKTNQDDKAKDILKEFYKTEYANTLDAKRVIVEALGELELYDKMLVIYDEIDKNNGADTISHAYSEELQYKARAASAAGDKELARRYLRRTIALNDSLHKRIDQEQMARMLSVYKVHEEKQKADKAASEAKMLLIIIVALGTITIITVILAIRILHQSKKMKEKNRSIVGIIDKVYKYRKNYVDQLQKEDIKRDETEENHLKEQSIVHEGKTDKEIEEDEDKHLFLLIDKAMREKKMYLDCDFQRQTLIDELHLDRNKIGRLIRKYSGHQNLSAYINSYRLEHACNILTNDDMRTTIDNISRQSGFTTIRTFQRLFKEAYGMTPAEFREAKHDKT